MGKMVRMCVGKISLHVVVSDNENCSLNMV